VQGYLEAGIAGGDGHAAGARDNGDVAEVQAAEISGGDDDAAGDEHTVEHHPAGGQRRCSGARRGDLHRRVDQGAPGIPAALRQLRRVGLRDQPGWR